MSGSRLFIFHQCQVNFQWVPPGHAGISRNEHADSLAKAGPFLLAILGPLSSLPCQSFMPKLV